MKFFKKNFRKIVFTLIILIVLGALTVFLINLYIIESTKSNIYQTSNEGSLKKTDCALVLGSLVQGDSLSAILKDRVDGGIQLYKAGKVSKLLLSGDHGKINYDEVNAMKDYAVKNGVPEDDIFLDHAGFSTYESIYRAKYIFLCKTITIVTQKYHLSRALFIANQLGVEAYGLDSTFNGNAYFDQYGPREVLARIKDFFTAMILKPKPTFMGDVIPITGSGLVTHDKG